MATTIDEGEVMAMQNPPHPGGIVRRECLEPLGLSVTWAAAGRAVGAVYIRRKVKGRKTVTTAKGTRA